MTSEETVTKIEKFSGEKREWPIWSEVFKARMEAKDLLEVMEMSPEEILTKVTSKDESMGNKDLMKKNKKVYSELMMSIDMKKAAGRIAIKLIIACKTKNFPQGDGALAWHKLKKKYEPSTSAELSQIDSLYVNAKLRPRQDPDVFVDYLEQLRTRLADLSSPVSDRRFLLNLGTKLTKEYENVVDKIHDLLDAKDPTEEDLSNEIELIRERLNEKFMRLNKGRRFSEDKDEEVDGEKALYAGTQFKGRCYKCGRVGHKGAKCKHKVKCFKCGKEGHKSPDCKENSEKAGTARDRTNGRSRAESEHVMMAVDHDEKPQVCHCVMAHIQDGSACTFCHVTQEDEPIKEMAKTSADGSGNKITSTTFLADTGASSHMINDDSGMFNVKKVKLPVTIGNGKSVICTKVGDIKLLAIQKNQEDIEIVLKEVMYVPELWTNLFSVGQALKKGWKLGNDEEVIFLEKSGTTLKFDKVIKTPRGSLVGVEMIPCNKISFLDETKRKKFNAEYLHQMLGHTNKRTEVSTANYYNWEIEGTTSVCEQCAKAKAKQKNLNKVTEERSKEVGERLFFDITPMKHPSYGGSRNWLLILDDYSDYTWSFFLKEKSDLAECMVDFIQDLEAKHDIKVKNIRCDNAGENKAFAKLACKKKLGLQFEWTAPGTPQQNGRVERKFATLMAYARSMMNDASFPMKMRRGLWTEAANTASKLNGVIYKESRDSTSYEMFFKKKPKIIDHLRRFGELGVVTFRKGTKGRTKVENKGRTCIFVGYSEDSPPDTYRMYDPSTRKVVNSRDIKWLNKLYREKYETSTSEKDDDSSDDESSYVEDIEIKNEIFSEEDKQDDMKEEATSDPNPTQNSSEGEEEEDFDDEEAPIATRTRGKIDGTQPIASRTCQKINEEVTTVATDVFKDVIPRKDHPGLPFDLAMFVSDVLKEEQDPKKVQDLLKEVKKNPSLFSDIFDEPSTFQEAWNHPDPFQREKWHEAIRKEIRKMIDRGVWRKIPRTSMPQGRRCVKFKWVFNIKRNGTFRARLVACGYSQIPGVDFMEHYAPVICDVTYRIMIIVQILKNLKAKIIDVETAFLHGELEEEIYMEVPDGVVHEKGEILLLQKTIYGLVQAARQYYKKWSSVLKTLGFKKSAIDPCLFVKTDGKTPMYVATYVDDNYVLGSDEDINKFIKDIKKHGLNVTVEDTLEDYLSCNIVFSDDKKRAWIGQPHLMKKIDKKFGEMIKKLPKYLTPGTPHMSVQKVEKEDDKIDPQKQSLYRSGVGMLLYLVKHSRPDIANATRNLSKGMSAASEFAWKELLRVLKFVVDTKNYGLKIEPQVKGEDMWNMTLYSDADWAGDKASRISISGFILYLCGSPILWRSRAQRSVTLSSGESEYVALSEAAKEVKFVSMLLTSMGIKVKYPIIVRIDNVAAMFMAETENSTSRTRHVDVRYHFVREFVEEGFIKIVFVSSDKNLSDMFTKNVNGNVYEEHHPKMIDKLENINPIEMIQTNRKGVGKC